MRTGRVCQTGIAVLGMALLTGAAPAQTRRSPGLKTGTTEAGKVGKSVSDPEFLNRAIMGGNGTIALAKLAIERAQSPKVKQAAQEMLSDHTEMQGELKQVAQTVGLKYENGPSPESRKAAQQLSGLSGSAFDKAFVADLIRMHQTEVTLYQAEAENAKVEPVMHVAGQQLPKLEAHLHALEALQRSL